MNLILIFLLGSAFTLVIVGVTILLINKTSNDSRKSYRNELESILSLINLRDREKEIRT